MIEPTPETPEEKIERLEQLCAFHGIDTGPLSEADRTASGPMPIGLSRQLEYAEERAANYCKALIEVNELTKGKRLRARRGTKYILQNLIYQGLLSSKVADRFGLIWPEDSDDDYEDYS